MLERILAWFLNNYIGEYFDNVNIDQLSIAYSEGEIELEGLPLKVEAFKNLGLPFDVKSGYIGKIRLKGSYRVRTEPWTITIDELFLVCAPLTHFTYDEEKESTNSQDVKLNLLESLENKWKMHYEYRQEPTYYMSSYSTWLTYSTSLTTDIIENLQLNIKSVHFRYEDDTSFPNTTLAGGVIIGDLSAFSTDEEWEPRFVNRTSSKSSKKLVQLEDLSIYWDSGVTMMKDMEFNDMVLAMRTLMDESINDDGSTSEHEYLLSPVNGKAYITRDSSEEPLRSKTKPRFLLDLELEEFVLTISVKQYLQLLRWSEEFSRTSKLLRNRKWRPKVPVHENAKLWWKYAINVNLHRWREKRKRENWVFVLERARIIKQYSDIYYAFLMEPDTLPREAKECKDQIEYDLTFEELYCLREAVYDRCQKFDQVPPRQANAESWWFLQSWVPSWVYTYEPEPEQTDEFDGRRREDSISSHWEELLDAFSSAENDTFLTRDTLFAMVNFSVQRASAIFIPDIRYLSSLQSTPTTHVSEPIFDRKPMLEFEVELPELMLETSPRCGQHRFEIKFKGFQVKDQAAPEPFFKYLSYSSNQSLEEATSQPAEKVRQTPAVPCVSKSPSFMIDVVGTDPVFELLVHKKEVAAAVPKDGDQTVRAPPAKTLQADLKLQFNQVDALFMSTSTKGENETANKLASATVISPCILSTLDGKEASIEGSLTRLQVFDCSVVRDRSQQVINIGNTTETDERQSLILDKSKAISFTIKRSFAVDMLDMIYRMDSLYYMHSAKLFHELASCALEFKAYYDSLASTIKVAAAKVAKTVLKKASSQVEVKNVVGKKRSVDNSLQRRISSFIKDLRIEIYIDSPLIILPSSPAAVMSFRNLFEPQEVSSPVNTAPSIYPADKLKCLSVGVEIKDGVLRFIDDCNETDIPLIEINTKELSIWHKMRGDEMNGSTKAIFSSDYFNRAMSGWEPLVEKWKFDVSWKVKLERWNQDGIIQRFTTESLTKKFLFNFSSPDTLNVNWTSTSLDLYRRVKNYWDVENIDCSQLTKRQAFVPFALKNETGCKMLFSVVRENASNLKRERRSGSSVGQSRLQAITRRQQEWIPIDPNELVPFSFENDQRIGHEEHHLPKSHKIIVHVDGWQPIYPVSVDKVGVYFREAKPENLRHESARIVFDITLEASAQKLISVRSALMVHNKTDHVMEIKFDGGTATNLYLMPQTALPVSLQHIRSKMRARPCEAGVNVCETHLEWEHVRRASEHSNELSQCSPISVTRHSSYNKIVPYYFCVNVSRDNFPPDTTYKLGYHSIRAMPAHHITLLPPVQLVNLLPFELRYRIPETAFTGAIKPGEKISLHSLDTTEEFSLEFTMEGFLRSKVLKIIPGGNKDYTHLIEMYDSKNRLLILHAQINVIAGAARVLQINIIAPYWLVNRTGLPILFKQEGSEVEAPNQFEEHEVARSISPLLFAFYEAEGSLSCSMRLGRAIGNARWCHSFYLEKGTQVRRLRVANSDPRRPDRVFEVGIDIRKGRGRYRDTRVVTFTPRYQIENSSNLKLDITQKFATQTEADLKQHVISALPKSNVSFHWPRTDHDRLICVRIGALANCHWSGGFPILANSSFHLNVRDDNGRSHFLRVEILTQNATSFIVFTDANSLPPPIRVANYSEVPIEFYQTGVTSPFMRSMVKAHSSAPYVWDEPTLKPHITVTAPGGCSATYNMYSLRPGDNLTYENFFYIAFSATFLSLDDNDMTSGLYSSQELTSTQLVLDVLEGSYKVVLSRKEPGKRSQLWRMDSIGHLMHEGSSPPRDPRRPSIRSDSDCFVLDVATACAHPGEYVPLALKKIDRRRALTQTWKFTSDGKLVSEFPKLSVQSKNGFLGLKTGTEAVLGPSQVVTYSMMHNGVPFEQAVTTHKMRKGSGMLAVSVVPDGPTRVLQIIDVRNVPSPDANITSPNWAPQHVSRKKTVEVVPSLELQIIVEASGIGLSIVNKHNEELIYITLRTIIFDYCYTVAKHSFNCSIRDIQVDSQLREVKKQVVIYPIELESSDPMYSQPAIRMSLQKLVVPHVNAKFFPEVQFKIKDMVYNLEEIVLLKLYEFFGFPWDDGIEALDEIEGQNAHKAITSALQNSFRLYLTLMEIVLKQVRLSVYTTSHMPLELIQLKKKVGLMLIAFEDAKVQLMPFKREYSLETFQFLINAVIEHYKVQLKNQAAKILVSVDFLGNPLGLMNDVSDGISELINEGSIGGLVTNITHGLSNSTAKFMSTLSDSLDLATLDMRHQEMRRRIKQDNSDHIRTGLKGLGVGIMGGMTSILTQTYEGAATDGLQGLVSGFGRGLLGTITKPAVGMLDFATEAASAVRDTSRKTSQHGSFMQRVRLPRQCLGSSGLLLPFDEKQAEGQQLFYRSSFINDKDEDELFSSFEIILPDTACLITSERVRFLTWGQHSIHHGKVMLSISFEHLVKCSVELGELTNSLMGAYVVMIVSDASVVSAEYSGFGPFGANTVAKKPMVRCSSDRVAIKTCQQVNYAKSSYDDKKFRIH